MREFGCLAREIMKLWMQRTENRKFRRLERSKPPDVAGILSQTGNDGPAPEEAHPDPVCR